MFEWRGPLTLHLNSKKTRTSCVTAYRDTIETWRSLISSFVPVFLFSLYFFLWLQVSTIWYQIYSKGFIFIWILHLAEMVGCVFQFWELELKTSAYHRNLIANAVSIKTKKIRVLFINLGTDTRLSLKTILSKACLGMWPNNWINLLNAKARSSDLVKRRHEPFCRKIHSHPWKTWVLKLIE